MGGEDRCSGRVCEVDAQTLRQVLLNPKSEASHPLFGERGSPIGRGFGKRLSRYDDVTGRARILTKCRGSRGVRTLLLPGGALVALLFPGLGVNDEAPVAVLRKK